MTRRKQRKMNRWKRTLAAGKKLSRKGKRALGIRRK